MYQEQASCRFGEESESAQSSCTVLLQGVGMHSGTVTNKTPFILKDGVFIKPSLLKTEGF